MDKEKMKFRSIFRNGPEVLAEFPSRLLFGFFWALKICFSVAGVFRWLAGCGYVYPMRPPRSQWLWVPQLYSSVLCFLRLLCGASNKISNRNFPFQTKSVHHLALWIQFRLDNAIDSVWRNFMEQSKKGGGQHEQVDGSKMGGVSEHQRLLLYCERESVPVDCYLRYNSFLFQIRYLLLGFCHLHIEPERSKFFWFFHPFCWPVQLDDRCLTCKTTAHPASWNRWRHVQEVHDLRC